MTGAIAARSARTAIRWPNVTALAVVAIGLGVLAWLPLFHLAANRLVVGTPVWAGAIPSAQMTLIAGLALAAAALIDFGRGRVAAIAGLALVSAAFVLFATALGSVASDLTAGQPPAARARLASGAWIGLALLGAAVAFGIRRTKHPSIGWLVVLGLLAALAWPVSSGSFDAMSLAVEYRARRASVHAAIVEHLALCAGAVALAIVATVALYGWRRARGIVDLAVNGVQVVPAVALLGALVAVTSSLLAAAPSLREVGLSALGPGPAILGIAAYLLLPLWRGLQAGLDAPDPATLDAATAIGLTPGQILRGIRLPLGAPILIGALRVASVQSIGLATLGALVGAGGLGGIVFDGMAQFAPDLILLGAIPIIALSLAADRAFGLIEDAAHRRWRS